MKSFLAMASQIIAFTLSPHLLAATGFAATVPVRHKHRRGSAAHPPAEGRRPVKAPAKRLVRPAVSVAPRAPVRVMAVQAQRAAVAGPRLAAAVPAPAIIAGGPWTSPTYADSTDGDNIDGEDLDIRRAAVESLGQYNGSVVVVDADSGRVLTMVNQRVALSSGFQPCSTVKVSVALAALSEKVIQPATKLNLQSLRHL